MEAPNDDIDGCVENASSSHSVTEWLLFTTTLTGYSVTCPHDVMLIKDILNGA
jgi:hypothetical protein